MDVAQAHNPVGGSSGPSTQSGALDELEQRVGGFGFEPDVADLVDNEQWIAAEPDEPVLVPAGVVGFQPGDHGLAVADWTR